MNIHPQTDDFSATAGTYGITPAMWVRVRPWTTGGDTGSGFSTEFADEAHLFDGYSRLPQVGSKVAAATSGTTLEFPDMGGFMYRNSVIEDVRVEAVFSVAGNVRLSSISISGGPVRYHGLLARLQNGSASATGDPDTERIDTQDGYFFGRLASSLVGWRYIIGRFTGGTLTVLASTTIAAYSEVSGGAPFVLQFKIETNGSGNVELSGYKLNATFGRESNQNPALVLSYTDTSGSKIAGVGRTGIALSCDRTNGSHRWAHLCSYAQCWDLDNAEWSYRDDWTRAHPLQAYAVTAAYSVYNGRSLQGKFIGDLYGPTDAFIGSNAYANFLKVGTNDIEFDPADADVPAWLPTAVNDHFVCPSQEMPRESDDWELYGIPPVTHRSIGVTFSSTGTYPVSPQPRSAGLFVRGHAYNLFIPDFGLIEYGYYCYLVFDDSTGNSWVYLYRRNASGFEWWDGVAGYASLSLAVDTKYILELRAESFHGSTGNWYVELKVYVAGAQVVLQHEDPNDPLHGIEIDASGTVTDDSGVEMTDNFSEGLVVWWIGYASWTRKLYLDDWSTGIDAGSGTPENDEATIALGAESDGATGTLVLPIDWPVGELTRRLRHKHRMESDHFYTNVRSHADRRRYRVYARAVEDADISTLDTFWDSHDGIEVPFSWDNPDGETLTMRFVTTDLPQRMRAPGVNSFEFELEEAF